MNYSRVLTKLKMFFGVRPKDISRLTGLAGATVSKYMDGGGVPGRMRDDTKRKLEGAIYAILDDLNLTLEELEEIQFI